MTQATLKVVGCFLGLSRKRSDARRYPAIDPLDSWSKYSGIAAAADLAFARSILVRGDEIDKMMRVIGEEGTAIEDFITYLKSEFLDYVYLQQNTFDDVDCAADEARQTAVFNQVLEVLRGEFHFPDKSAAHAYFMQLRQMFIDWNYLRMDDPGFTRQQDAIRAKLEEGLRHA
ncbi:V-type ATP synthase alpha chain [bioreactor metagenome]|uniref:V-type ATP synthase alpha chain n=1 Tax=bioreactor metagenome TaxID=1076179 RepID=A0A645F3Q1_9ZZZZ